MEISNESINKGRRGLFLVALLNFSDWLCTVTLLRYNGFQEINPLMVQIIDKPLFCFFVKCVIPLIMILYIYLVLPKSSEKIVKSVSVVTVIISIVYIGINILHIFNFSILFNLH